MITINVTQEDIDAGLPIKCIQCPIALAAKRVFGHEVSVAATYIHDIKSGYYDLPRAAVDFVAAFDKGRTVTPFSFEVQLS